jgi:hypothetical protein
MLVKNKSILILIAILIMAVSLMNAGCVGTLRNILGPSASVTPTPTVTAQPTIRSIAASATPSPTLASTTVPGNVDIIFTPPPEAGFNQSTPIHTLTGNVTVNGKPAVGYTVLINTAPGFEYGNTSRSDGSFMVRFRDDNSSTYMMKLDNSLGILIYQDTAPMPMSYSGPMTIALTIPSTNIVSVTITPSYTSGDNVTV